MSSNENGSNVSDRALRIYSWWRALGNYWRCQRRFPKSPTAMRCFKPSSNRGDPLWFFRSSRDSCPSTCLSLGVLGPVFFCFELAMCMAKYWNRKQNCSWGLVVGGWGCWEGLKHTSALPLLQSWRTDVTAVTHIHSVASVLAADKQEVLRSILMFWNAEAAPFLRSIVEETRTFIWNEGFSTSLCDSRHLVRSGATSASARDDQRSFGRWTRVFFFLSPSDLSLHPSAQIYGFFHPIGTEQWWKPWLAGYTYNYTYTHII